jgi:hypothetical protein
MRKTLHQVKRAINIGFLSLFCKQGIARLRSTDPRIFLNELSVGKRT